MIELRAVVVIASHQQGHAKRPYTARFCIWWEESAAMGSLQQHQVAHPGSSGEIGTLTRELLHDGRGLSAKLSNRYLLVVLAIVDLA